MTIFQKLNNDLEAKTALIHPGHQTNRLRLKEKTEIPKLTNLEKMVL